MQKREQTMRGKAIQNSMHDEESQQCHRWNVSISERISSDMHDFAEIRSVVNSSGR